MLLLSFSTTFILPIMAPKQPPQPISPALLKRLDEIRERIEHLESVTWAPASVVDDHAASLVRLDELQVSCDALVFRSDADVLATEALLAEHKDMKLAIAEGIERVDRAERRIKDTVRRARKKLADSGLVDDGLEAEEQELRLLDGEPSEGVEVLKVREDVEVDNAPHRQTLRDQLRRRGLSK